MRDPRIPEPYSPHRPTSTEQEINALYADLEYSPGLETTAHNDIMMIEEATRALSLETDPAFDEIYV